MRIAWSSAFLGFCLVARAELHLAPIFTDHAVLQRDKPIPVWGRADAGQKVTVEFRGQTAGTVTDSQGQWQVTLPEMKADGDAADLVVTAEKTITLRDVVVGEVWLCSGQSNMEYTVDKVNEAARAIAAADFPMIRHIKIPRALASGPVRVVDAAWQPASSQTVGDFSAVAWFFARDLWQTLKVPVGVINASWGGSAIESWLSAEALAADPAFAVVGQRWEAQRARFPQMEEAYKEKLAKWEEDQKAARASGREFKERKPNSPFHGAEGKDEPAGMFNGMIKPLTPYAMRGILWYQGERNYPRADEYQALLAALIGDWRKNFRQGELPFYLVQLPNYRIVADPSGEGYAPIRQAQAKVLSLPATAMAVTIDIGEPDNLHPRNKQDVGLRLARIAKAKVYQFGGVWSGPVFQSAVRERNALRLSFDHAEGGLVARETPLPGFEVAGADGKYHTAVAKVDGTAVLVEADAVPEPVAARYAWADTPRTALFNNEGLPAAPFHYVKP